MKILAIDDEVACTYQIEKVLKKVCPNDTIEVYNDYKNFMDAFDDLMPDVVFLDIEMPEKNGIELAKELLNLKPNVNIIYVTAYPNFALDAFGVNASGYILKPVNAESVIKALTTLRYDVVKKDISIRTFGNFSISYKGKPVIFRSPSSKEILAYLVDRQGAVVSKKELGGIICEDDWSASAQASLSRSIRFLKEDLEEAGIKDFIYIENGYYVDLSKADCDLIKYLKGLDNSYIGEYMDQYSWAELRKFELEEKRR